jgi:toxin secretion/phage lysis holin
MENIMTTLKYIGACIGSALAYFLGQWDILIQILITLTVFDFITGVLSAGYNKKLCSDIGYKGIVRKIGIYIIVALACLLDKLMGTNLVLRGATIGFYIVIEATSILENWGSMGLALPKVIREALKQLKDKMGDDE